jgi:cell division protein FtsI (penicillin-binding protein 3)
MLATLLAAAFACLGYRLTDLQVLRHDELRAKAEENTHHEFPIQARRGDILDAKGNLLATSIFVKTVCADPSLIANQADRLAIARAVAPLLQTNGAGPNEAELCQRLLPRLFRNEKGETVTNQYVVLKQQVTAETWQKIQAAMNHLSFNTGEKKPTLKERAYYNSLRKAIFASSMDDQLRVYPNQSLAAHVLGYTMVTNEDLRLKESGDDEMHFRQLAGVDGIEAKFDAELRGVPGWRYAEMDRSGKEVVSMRGQNVEPHDGLNVVLTIDAVIQHILESALADAMEKHTPVSVTGIVVDTRTGKILAMATLPNFDPNNLNGSSPDARRNRVITDIMEPGSTFKTVVVSAALNERLVTLNDSFFCENGAFSFAGHVLHDAEGHRFGNLTVQEILMKSSNIGAAKIGIKLGEKKLYDYMLDFGLGARTDIPLPAEVNVKVHPFKDMAKVALARVPMGQSVNVTRLQMAMAVSAIANKGVLMRPMLVDRLQDEDGKVLVRYSPQPVRRVIDEEAAHEMVQALKTVVTPNGTAPAAALEHYTVAGKTGTAEKPAVGVGGYLAGKYVSSFIGFFPADDPQICISIVLDEPDTRKGYYGGLVAAPVFKEIGQRAANYLNIRPDVIDDRSAPQIAVDSKAVPRTQ